MAPNKFENNIKKTLEERQIQPSSIAWNQLSDSLDKADRKTSNRYLWFIGIAASIIGVLFLVNTFQPFQSIENTASPSLVNTNSETDLETKNESETNAIADNVEVESTSVEGESDDEIENNITAVSNKNLIASSKKTLKISEAFVDKSEKIKNVQNNSIVTTDLKNTPKNTFAQSDVGTGITKASLNSEVDTLLKQAKSKVSTLAVSKENTNSINANSLLEDVELDLEKSFRDKVFETLKTNFSVVKSAVADRNN